MDVLVLFHQLEIVEPFVTCPASELIVTSVFAFVMAKTLDCGKALTTLVTNETTLAIMGSLVDIFKMSGGKRFRALRANKSLLIIMFGGNMFQKGLFSFELSLAVGTGEGSSFIMGLHVSKHVVLSGKRLITFLTAVDFVFHVTFNMSLVQARAFQDLLAVLTFYA